MLALARKAGFRIAPSPDLRGVMLLEKPLDAPVPQLGCNDAEAGALA
jgi:hypothetical protein